jgi:hypothetical protein
LAIPYAIWYIYDWHADGETIWSKININIFLIIILVFIFFTKNTTQQREAAIYGQPHATFGSGNTWLRTSSIGWSRPPNFRQIETTLLG